MVFELSVPVDPSHIGTYPVHIESKVVFAHHTSPCEYDKLYSLERFSRAAYEDRGATNHALIEGRADQIGLS